jgi:hypothetical protein
VKTPVLGAAGRPAATRPRGASRSSREDARAIAQPGELLAVERQLADDVAAKVAQERSRLAHRTKSDWKECTGAG